MKLFIKIFNFNSILFLPFQKTKPYYLFIFIYKIDFKIVNEKIILPQIENKKIILSQNLIYIFFLELDGITQDI